MRFNGTELRRRVAGGRIAPLGLALCFLANFGVRANEPITYHKDIEPIIRRSCEGCHNPVKADGKWDVSSFELFMKGGKTEPPVTPGEPDASPLIDFIIGDEPIMPKNGEPLSKEEIALIERWIREGAIEGEKITVNETPEKPPLYLAPPAISSVAFSPDGKLLAVTGYHEIILHHADGSGIVARLLGPSPRIESVTFSSDGKWLAACGGKPARFGEIQVWDVESKSQVHSYRFSRDVLYGISLNSDVTKAAVGGADKVVRLINLADGAEEMRFENHADWVLATTFASDGKRLLSGGRDSAMKLINISNGQFIDDINNPLEPILCFARRPNADEVVYGGSLGVPRIYKISENTKRTNARNDTNLLREFERQPGPVHAVAWSPDGGRVALGGAGGEVRIYSASNGKRTATLKGHEGAVFATSFAPDGKSIVTAGFDGMIRLFNPETGELVKAFEPAPVLSREKFIEALGDVAVIE